MYPCAPHVHEQLYTIHDITCGPAFKTAALELLRGDETDQGGRGQSGPVILVLETLRWEKYFFCVIFFVGGGSVEKRNMPWAGAATFFLFDVVWLLSLYRQRVFDNVVQRRYE